MQLRVGVATHRLIRLQVCLSVLSRRAKVAKEMGHQFVLVEISGPVEDQLLAGPWSVAARGGAAGGVRATAPEGAVNRRHS